MKKLRALLTSCAFLFSATCHAAPPQIEAMNSLPGAGSLYLDYCLVGHHVCVTVRAICYGQCGNQDMADDMGYGCSGDIQGFIPPLYHYAGWSAKRYDNGEEISGLPTPGYDHVNCHNRR